MSIALVFILMLSPFFALSALFRRPEQHPATVFFTTLILAPLAFVLTTWIGFTVAASAIVLFIACTIWIALGFYLWKRNKIQLPQVIPSRVEALLLLSGLLLYTVYAVMRPFSEHDTFEYMALGQHLTSGFDPFDYRFNPSNGFYYVGYHPPVYALFFSMASILGDSGYLSVKILSGYFYLTGSLLAAGFLSRHFQTAFWFTSLLVFSCFGWFFSALQFHLETMRIAGLVVLLTTAFVSLRAISSSRSWLLLGMVCGLASGVHFINLVVCCILAFAACIQHRNKISIQHIAVFGSSFFLCGGFYYLTEFFEKSTFYSF